MSTIQCHHCREVLILDREIKSEAEPPGSVCLTNLSYWCWMDPIPKFDNTLMYEIRKNNEKEHLVMWTGDETWSRLGTHLNTEVNSRCTIL